MSFAGKILIDTDTLSYYLRQDLAVVDNALRYATIHGTLSFSEITRYEIYRGLLAVSANARLKGFERICRASHVLPVTWNELELAAKLWATLRKSGQVIGDGDLVISATAIRRGWAVATHNVSHFSRIEGLKVVDWTQPQP